VTRESELPEIEQFLTAKGATRCPTVYVHPTSTNFSAAEEAHRLGRVKVTAARGRYSHSAARTPGATVRRLGRPIRRDLYPSGYVTGSAQAWRRVEEGFA
jgi:hypothetical protein